MMTEGTVCGWSAECTDCPYTIEPMYGARCFPYSESGDRADVEHWADQHRARFPGHQPKITAFSRWTMIVEERLPVSVFETLFGRLPAEPERDPVAELLDAVQRVKNIVWQNFGIEPGIPTRALPAGTGCRWCDCPADRCAGYGYGRKCCPDCTHGRPAIPRVDDRDWFYLIRFPDGHVAQCAGDWDVAHKHLRLIRAEPCFAGGPVPTLIGAYPPDSIGGPEGRGGVYSFGYSPDVIGSIDVPRPEWRTAR
ncbi:hypothetical protein KDW75_gp55 [Mycobacterium phage Mercurio]|uniref:Uncharacterized protein n=1 Tax=Mycobacterium phage Mercurio TaxID=2575612 RepID=A0A5J6T8A0_9CAUD|nr:hypothetical protein KDW75_gp55 [Mycobacterium phage Mercurio]QFG06057.1 hypothetical protein PBI_MERCURIO_55 [Mycobacterium phage Mercurio]